MGGAAHDVVVLGASVDGLVAATLLARAGRQVLVLDEDALPGEASAGRPFHPDYRHAGLLHDTAWVRPHVVRGLGLEERGLRWRPPPDLHVGDAAGEIRRVPFTPSAWGEEEAVAPELLEGLAGLAPLAGAFLDREPPDPWGRPGWGAALRALLALRRLGRREAVELARLAALPLDDLLVEAFPDPAWRAALALEGLLGAWAGPPDPLGGLPWLLRMASVGQELEGGPAALVDALVEAAGAAGVDLRTGVTVSGILLEDGRAVGVALEGGEVADAGVVISATGPRRTLARWIDPAALAGPVLDRVASLRTRGALGQLLLGVAGDPAPPAGDAAPLERLRVGADLREWEAAFHAAARGELPERPCLDVRIPSRARPDLAPAGHHVLSVLVYALPPRGPGGGWTEAARAALIERVLARLEGVLPGLSGAIVARELWTPADLERVGLDGGNLLHVEPAVDQLGPWRPAAGLGREPLPGLLLASRGTHPGLAETGAAGWLAARRLLEA